MLRPLLTGLSALCIVLAVPSATEAQQCPNPLDDLQTVACDSGTLSIDLGTAAADHDACGDGGGPDKLYRVTAETTRFYRVRLEPIAGGSASLARLSLSCERSGVCNFDDGSEALQLLGPSASDSYLQVRHISGGTAYLLEFSCGEADCADGLDNDGDGLSDCDDPDCVDADEDNAGAPVCGGDDCDDYAPATYPNADDVPYDGVDQDCNGSDRIDVDGDGFAGGDGPDCDDQDPDIRPGVTDLCDGVDNNCDGRADEDFDRDGDGWVFCDRCGPSPTLDPAGRCDCDDRDPRIRPGAPELCDGIDNDCEGPLDPFEIDLDGDGWAPCSDGSRPPDCDDADAARHPGAAEDCTDGIDGNCNGISDEDEALTDADADGELSCDGDCDDSDATVNSSAPELCDGRDNDCDGRVDEDFDADADGYPDGAIPECSGFWGSRVDCDDTDAGVHPFAGENCLDGIDNNCDGSVDLDEDRDRDGSGICGGDCNDTDPEVFPGTFEACNGRDDNCDGQVDEGSDSDGDGVPPCHRDCDDSRSDVSPLAEEICDNGTSVDNDCDNSIDEGFDSDGDGVSSCNGIDCDDNNPNTSPWQPEICDGEDNDCNGFVDESFDLDGDGYIGFTDECEGLDVIFDCDDSDARYRPDPQVDEECRDGVDNDCDGAVDGDDLECKVYVRETPFGIACNLGTDSAGNAAGLLLAGLLLAFRAGRRPWRRT